MAKRVDLNGIWKVQVSQKIKKKSLSYQVICDLCQVENQIIGTLHYNLELIKYSFTSRLKKMRKLKIAMQGRLVGNTLHITYDNDQKNISQFGSFMLDILSNKKMSGKFIGYGPESDGIISGKITFIRS